MKNFIIGIYTRFQVENVINYSIHNRKTKNIILAIGPVCGYQIEFGRFNIEGTINVGIRKIYWPNGRSVGGVPDDSVDYDFLAGIKVGWKIF